MKTIIAGTRTITEMRFLKEALAHSGWQITEVVCGKARGVDTLGEAWAKDKGIPVRYFPADWSGLGKRAGFVRNAQMAEYAEALVLVWDGCSRGSASMLELAKRKGLRIFEWIV
jgi:hypothetical protein